MDSVHAQVNNNSKSHTRTKRGNHHQLQIHLVSVYEMDVLQPKKTAMPEPEARNQLALCNVGVLLATRIA